jgi:hypothetical protein
MISFITKYKYKTNYSKIISMKIKVFKIYKVMI